MASELRVNTLKDASGNNSIATSFVASGSAKAYGNIEQGTTALKSGSLNTASVSDDGQGICTISYTSAMSDSNYAIAGYVYNDRTGLVNATSGYTYTTTQKKFDVVDSRDVSREDYDFTYTVNGDLA
tara:strand:- start:787 stop:1167 length:381 start_codon:yes stop_codon:yes gene_type:complete